MTRKDYVAFAAALAQVRIMSAHWPRPICPALVIAAVEDCLLAVFRADNSRFNRDRFLAASGRSEGSAE